MAGVLKLIVTQSGSVVSVNGLGGRFGFKSALSGAWIDDFADNPVHG
jgi:hypothetical protein